MPSPNLAQTCIVVGVTLMSSVATLHAQTEADQLTPLQAQADFDVLRKALEEVHDGLYRFSSRSEMSSFLDLHRAQLNRPMTKMEFIGIISEMLGGTRDGHMRLEYDQATTAALAHARLFPFRVMMEGSRIMVLLNDTPADSTIRPGMEILSINGRTTRGVLDVILPKLPGDGFIETGKRAQLGRRFGRYYWLFVDQTAEFTVVARDLAGRMVTARVAGVLDSARSANTNPVNTQMQASLSQLEGPKENVSLRSMADPDIAYLRIRSFGGEAFPQSIEAAFRTVRDRGTKALILDLRGNGGGVDQYGALLVSQFTDRPFRYFDRIHLVSIRPSFATWKPSTFEDLRNGTVPDPAGGHLVTATLHNGVADQAPARNPFLGRVFILIDGGTFSTAADVTAVLHHLKRATFVGEETGGTYEGNTSGLNALITMPNSELRLKIPMYGYFNAVSPALRGRGTQPDYPVEKRVADLLRGIDAQLQRAVALAGGQGAETTVPLSGQLELVRKQ